VENPPFTVPFWTSVKYQPADLRLSSHGDLSDGIVNKDQETLHRGPSDPTEGQYQDGVDTLKTSRVDPCIAQRDLQDLVIGPGLPTQCGCHRIAERVEPLRPSIVCGGDGACQPLRDRKFG
jgi:hypothetical protein